MTIRPMRAGVDHELSPLEQAAGAAFTAAVKAHLRIHELDSVERIREAAELFSAVWSVSPDEPLIPANTLRALGHSGNYVYGGYDDGRMTAAIVGFLGRLDGSLQLHSHILGVSPRSQGKSVGFAMKQHQRAWAVRQGIDVVTWTFDPLVRRNAYFNIAKLGATVSAFYPNFYGAMNDGINDGDESDRVLVEWPLAAPSVVEASEGRPPELDLPALKENGAAVVLQGNDDGTPAVADRRGRTLLAAIPEDIVRIRAEDRPLAERWRSALRDVFGGALEDGYTAVGMTRSGWYVLREAAEAPRATH
jgi:predicted GNAT superfamily acetyltransferase